MMNGPCDYDLESAHESAYLMIKYAETCAKNIKNHLRSIDKRIDDIRNLIIDHIECTTGEGDEKESYKIDISSAFEKDDWFDLMYLLNIHLDYGREEAHEDDE